MLVQWSGVPTQVESWPGHTHNHSQTIRSTCILLSFLPDEQQEMTWWVMVHQGTEKAPEEKPKGWTEGPPWWMYICIKGLKHICLFQTVVIKMILIWKCINVASLKKALDERTHFMQVWTHLHLSDTDSHTAPLRSLYEYLKRDGWTQ